MLSLFQYTTCLQLRHRLRLHLLLLLLHRYIILLHHYDAASNSCPALPQKRIRGYQYGAQQRHEEVQPPAIQRALPGAGNTTAPYGSIGSVGTFLLVAVCPPQASI